LLSWLRIEAATLDLQSQSGAYDHTAMEPQRDTGDWKSVLQSRLQKRKSSLSEWVICLLGLVRGLGQKNLTWVGSIFCCLGWDSHLWFEFRKFPLQVSNFSIFSPSGQKVPGTKKGWPLIYCGSKVCSGRVESGLISNWDSYYNVFIIVKVLIETPFLHLSQYHLEDE